MSALSPQLNRRIRRMLLRGWRGWSSVQSGSAPASPILPPAESKRPAVLASFEPAISDSGNENGLEEERVASPNLLPPGKTEGAGTWWIPPAVAARVWPPERPLRIHTHDMVIELSLVRPWLHLGGRTGDFRLANDRSSFPETLLLWLPGETLRVRLSPLSWWDRFRGLCVVSPLRKRWWRSSTALTLGCFRIRIPLLPVSRRLHPPSTGRNEVLRHSSADKWRMPDVTLLLPGTQQRHRLNLAGRATSAVWRIGFGADCDIRLPASNGPTSRDRTADRLSASKPARVVACLLRTPEQLSLIPLDAHVPTIVNGRKVSFTRLDPGDRLRFGDGPAYELVANQDLRTVIVGSAEPPTTFPNRETVSNNSEPHIHERITMPLRVEL